MAIIKTFRMYGDIWIEYKGIQRNLTELVRLTKGE